MRSTLAILAVSFATIFIAVSNASSKGFSEIPKSIIIQDEDHHKCDQYNGDFPNLEDKECWKNFIEEKNIGFLFEVENKFGDYLFTGGGVEEFTSSLAPYNAALEFVIKLRSILSLGVQIVRFICSKDTEWCHGQQNEFTQNSALTPFLRKLKEMDKRIHGIQSDIPALKLDSCLEKMEEIKINLGELDYLKGLFMVSNYTSDDTFNDDNWAKICQNKYGNILSPDIIIQNLESHLLPGALNCRQRYIDDTKDMLEFGKVENVLLFYLIKAYNLFLSCGETYDDPSIMEYTLNRLDKKVKNIRSFLETARKEKGQNWARSIFVEVQKGFNAEEIFEQLKNKKWLTEEYNFWQVDFDKMKNVATVGTCVSLFNQFESTIVDKTNEPNCADEGLVLFFQAMDNREISPIAIGYVKRTKLHYGFKATYERTEKIGICDENTPMGYSEQDECTLYLFKCKSVCKRSSSSGAIEKVLTDLPRVNAPDLWNLFNNSAFTMVSRTKGYTIRGEEGEYRVETMEIKTDLHHNKWQLYHPKQTLIEWVRVNSTMEDEIGCTMDLNLVQENSALISIPGEGECHQFGYRFQIYSNNVQMCNRLNGDGSHCTFCSNFATSWLQLQLSTMNNHTTDEEVVCAKYFGEIKSVARDVIMSQDDGKGQETEEVTEAVETESLYLSIYDGKKLEVEIEEESEEEEMQETEEVTEAVVLSNGDGKGQDTEKVTKTVSNYDEKGQEREGVAESVHLSKYDGKKLDVENEEEGEMNE